MPAAELGRRWALFLKGPLSKFVCNAGRVFDVGLDFDTSLAWGEEALLVRTVGTGAPGRANEAAAGCGIGEESERIEGALVRDVGTGARCFGFAAVEALARLPSFGVGVLRSLGSFVAATALAGMRLVGTGTFSSFPTLKRSTIFLKFGDPALLPGPGVERGAIGEDTLLGPEVWRYGEM